MGKCKNYFYFDDETGIMILLIFLGKNGAEGIRTPDPRDANAMLYQLSYNPKKHFMII